MTTKHTPGPWEFTGKYLATRADNTLLSIKPESAEGGAHFAANARLMAAAPDLLEALEAVVEDEDYAYSKARAAIAKATE